MKTSVGAQIRGVKRGWALMFSGLGLALTLTARQDYMAVSATAAPDYERTTATGMLRPESYVFTPGREFGAVHDKSLQMTGFDGVVRALAPALAKRQYWPAKVPADADLIIVVHWGETVTYDDPNRDRTMEQLNVALADYNAGVEENGMADPGELNQALTGQEDAASISAAYAQDNAALLGYTQTLRKEEKRLFASEEERTMRAELGDNRYFVVLMAYDYQALREKKERRLRWVTRMSVRSAGKNFLEAMPSMLTVATPVLGTQQDGLVHVKGEILDRNAQVEIGETTVVSDKP